MRQLFQNALSKALRIDITEGNYWTKEKAPNSFAMVLAWLVINCSQAYLWRGVSRSRMAKKFKKANQIQKVKASKGTTVEAPVYAFGYNYSQLGPMAVFSLLLLMTYLLEWNLNGAGISPKLPDRLQTIFKVMALAGFESSLLMTKFFGDDEEEKPSKK